MNYLYLYSAFYIAKLVIIFFCIISDLDKLQINEKVYKNIKSIIISILPLSWLIMALRTFYREVKNLNN